MSVALPIVGSDLELALHATRLAAAIVSDAFGAQLDPEMKGVVDPVTEADRAAEDAVREALTSARPDDLILGEERGGAAWDRGRVWIVDPLDGTVNFVHRVPHVGVSVALVVEGVAEVGVVHDVVRDEVYAARRQAGATLDGVAMTVSGVSDVGQALVGTGFPYDRRRHAAALAEVVGRVLGAAQGIRRMGSAALDLCYVASGRLDAYWETRLAPWDAAAGTLIVTEAGGRVTDLTGTPHRLDAPGVLASNGLVHDAMLEIVAGGA